MHSDHSGRKGKDFVAGAAGVCMFAAAEIIRELHFFQIRRYSISLPGMKKGQKTKVLFLTDLHGKQYGKANRKLIAKIREEDPDYILVGGDTLTRTKRETERAAVLLLAQLTRICPVYMANGNHEQKMKEKTDCYGKRYKRYKEAVKKAGVHLLENRSVHLLFGDQPVRVTGLEIPLSCYSRTKGEELSVPQIEEKVGGASSEEYQILLAHNPSCTKQYWEWGADLVLSGHLHGGIVRIPGIGGVISPQFKLFPRYSGDMYKKDGHISVVSKGLGTHTVNVRLFNPAELTAITFSGETVDC